MQYTLVLLMTTCSSLLITSTMSARPSNDDITIIRQRVLKGMVWPTNDSLPSIVQRALSYTRVLNASCYWPDINYYDDNIVLWDPARHMDRIRTMLQALTVNSSTVYNDTKIRTAVHCALNVWLTNDWQNPNWWWNPINTTVQTTGQLLMLGNDATTFEIEKIKEISFRANWWDNPGETGANLVWMIQAGLYRSLATNNVTGWSREEKSQGHRIYLRLIST